jgi:hypothetical protein
MTRAQACAGHAAETEIFYRLAEQAGALIAEEDRQMFQKDLVTGPWFDLTNLHES